MTETPKNPTAQTHASASPADVGYMREKLLVRVSNPRIPAEAYDGVLTRDVQGQMLQAMKDAYRKHHLGDDSISWNELSDRLCDALCQAMGDKKFQEWLRRIDDPTPQSRGWGAEALTYGTNRGGAKDVA